MKKYFMFAVMAMAGALLLSSCTKSDLKGFKKSKTGIHYRFDKQNKGTQQVQVGDILVCEMAVMVGSETDTVFSNIGHPDRMFTVQECGQFKGDLPDGLQMLHLGDQATFAIELDSVARFLQPNQMPRQYKPGQGMKMFYAINLVSIISKEEVAAEQARFMENMELRKGQEAEVIAKYVADNNITTQPTEEGLYVIVKKKGNGAKVAAGKKVKMNYTGRLLEDGKMFDTSVEADAKEGDIYNAQRPYEPLEYVVGQTPLIQGWDKGVMDQPAGSELTLIIPSALGYGARGAGDIILAYSPLRFDITIVSVE